MTTTTRTRKKSSPKKPAAAKGAKPAAKAPTDPTLTDLAEGYLQHMEAEGRSEATCFSYRMELRLALGALGEKTKLASLTAKRVGAFFESDAVMKTRAGKPKNPRSYSKTRRVLRLALTWAKDQGWIEAVPVPETKKSAPRPAKKA